MSRNLWGEGCISSLASLELSTYRTFSTKPWSFVCSCSAPALPSYAPLSITAGRILQTASSDSFGKNSRKWFIVEGTARDWKVGRRENQYFQPLLCSWQCFWQVTEPRLGSQSTCNRRCSSSSYNTGSCSVRRGWAPSFQKRWLEEELQRPQQHSHRVMGSQYFLFVSSSPRVVQHPAADNSSEFCSQQPLGNLISPFLKKIAHFFGYLFKIKFYNQFSGPVCFTYLEMSLFFQVEVTRHK